MLMGFLKDSYSGNLRWIYDSLLNNGIQYAKHKKTNNNMLTAEVDGPDKSYFSLPNIINVFYLFFKCRETRTTSSNTKKYHTKRDPHFNLFDYIEVAPTKKYINRLLESCYLYIECAYFSACCATLKFNQEYSPMLTYYKNKMKKQCRIKWSKETIHAIQQ